MLIRYISERMVNLKMSTRGEENQSDRENEIVSKALKEPPAFAELSDCYVDKVYTYVFYRTGNKALTEDIVSSAFLKALNNLNTFRSRNGGFGAWILRIAYNLIVDNYHKNKRLTSWEENFIAGQEVSPEQKVLQDEEEKHLRQIVQKLPVQQREVVILKYSLDFRNQEIAEIIGKSESAVSSLLHRALQNLRKEVT